MKLHVLFAALILIAAALLSSSQPPPREQVGPLPDGGFLLNSGWRVKPAGAQIPLDTLPMSSVLSKDGRFSDRAERRLQSALAERAGYQGWPRGGPHAGGGRVAGHVAFAEREDIVGGRRIASVGLRIFIR